MLSHRMTGDLSELHVNLGVCDVTSWICAFGTHTHRDTGDRWCSSSWLQSLSAVSALRCLSLAVCYLSARRHSSSLLSDLHL